MAGSYYHCIDGRGRLLKGPKLSGMLDAGDTGDVYEAIEEMFGMIWWLAKGDAVKVEEARANWEDGLALSPGPHRSRVQL